MQDFNCGCMQQPMNMMPCCGFPMAAMPQQLESMYPKTYHVIQPEVDKVCDEFMMCGQMCPTQEQMDAMVDHVYSRVEINIEAVIKQSPREEERQFVGGGRRILRDFIGALLITNLIRRRPPYFYNYPFYGPGFIPPFGFGPGPFVGGVVF